jgi:VanZ family protein
LNNFSVWDIVFLFALWYVGKDSGRSQAAANPASLFRRRLGSLGRGGVYCRHIQSRRASARPVLAKKLLVDPMTTLLKIVPKVPALLVVSAIWVLSSQSTLPVPKGILGFDKLQHLLAYLCLAASFVFWFSPAQRRFHRFRTFLLLSLVGSLYGVIDEAHQFFVPGRDCNVWDWIADTMGALLGAGVALMADRLVLRRRSHG